MAEETIKIDNSTPPPKAGVSPTIFWIVTIVLAIGIGAVYMMLDKKLDDSTKQLSELLKSSAAKQESALAKQGEDIHKSITEGVTKQETLNKQINDMIAKNQLEATTLVAALDKKFAESKTEVAKNFATVEDKVMGTKTDIGKVDQRVTYLDKKVEALQTTVSGLGTKIDEIKVGSDALKAEQAKLLGEIKSVAGRSDVTQGELDKLTQRTKDFELRVLLERAKQAAADAEKFDYANLFEKMDALSPQKAPNK